MEKTVLLTGVPGWLGSRFLEILISGFEGEGPPNDWKIRCLSLDDRLAPEIEVPAKKKAVEKFKGDITKRESLGPALKGADIVFHMAGVIHPKKVRDFFRINTLGTENLLRESLNAGVARFIYISSNSVAGINESRDKLFSEHDLPRPYLNYGLSKYCAEETVKSMRATGQIQTVILRPCWFYGPGQPERQTRFFKMIEKARPFIFGDGNNLRSMTYVDNLCQAMLLAAESRKADGQTYWIADKRPYSTYEIYKTIAGIFEIKNLEPRYLPDFVSTGCFWADTILQEFNCYIPEIHVAGEMNKDIACAISKAQEELGYDPKIELLQGMYRSIKWCKQKGLL